MQPIASRVYVFFAGILALALFTACSAPPTPVPAQTSAPTLTIVPSTAVPSATVTSVTPAPTIVPSPVVPTAQQTTATMQPTVQATVSGALTLAPRPTAKSTPAALLPAPEVIQPGIRASYSYKSPVILTWKWERSLGPGEYFEVQLSREDSAPADLACTTATTYQINPPPPLGFGWYQWRVLARQGQVQESGCTSQGDLTQPSEIRTLDWRMPPEPSTYP